MIDLISDQIFAFIKTELLSFYEIGTYYRNQNFELLKEINHIESYRVRVTDIDSLKDAVYNRVLILEPSSKSIFIRKFIDIIAEYTDEDIESSVALEILNIKGIKPSLLKPLEQIGYNMLSDSIKLNYYELNSIDFNFNEETKKLSIPYVQRFHKFKDFLIEYSSEFSNGINLNNGKNTIISNKVFIVHGHNEGIKYEVAQTLNKIGLTPIILHEQQSENKTIIEKIEANSDVKFAIILLTDDDLGKAKNVTELNPRARQNVIFEMGYFIGLLGRKNVCCIVNNSNIEKPSDINGIVYINYEGNWVVDIAKELKSSGLKFDMNTLV